MWTETFRSTCWDQMRYSRDLLGGNTGQAKKWRGTRRKLGNPQILIQVSWLWRRAGRNEGIHLCEATSSCLPRPMHVTLPVEPSHFLLNLVSVAGFSRIWTLTSIFPPGTFTLVTILTPGWDMKKSYRSFFAAVEDKDWYFQYS